MVSARFPSRIFAFATSRGARPPGFSSHGACTAFDTCGPSGCFPTPGRICQEAPRLDFSSARLLSFMFLAPFMLGLSPTGMDRLPSGHVDQGHGHDNTPGSSEPHLRADILRGLRRNST